MNTLQSKASSLVEAYVQRRAWDIRVPGGMDYHIRRICKERARFLSGCLLFQARFPAMAHDVIAVAPEGREVAPAAG